MITMSYGNATVGDHRRRITPRRNLYEPSPSCLRITGGRGKVEGKWSRPPAGEPQGSRPESHEGKPGGTRMCPHTPPCPDASAPDREAAHTVVSHPEQGWSLLCNGVVIFEDT